MSLAKKAAAGFLWATAANLGSRVITIGSTFVLTRFLTPEVQGEVNVATVFVATLGWATSFGVGQYLAAHPKAGRQVAFHGSMLVLVSGLLMIAVCVGMRGPVGEFLHTPDMAHYVPGLAVSQFIDRFGAVPRSVLVRDMRFSAVGARVGLGELAFAVASVAFAALGWGGDAIVGANLVRAVLGFGFLALIVDRREYFEPSPFDLARLREILRFGLPISISYVFHVGSTQWDNLFIAYRFGESANGLYNQAYRLADLPATNVGEQVNDVLVPTFARVDDPEARARGLGRAAGLMSLVVFPMSAGLGVVAPTLVAAFYPASYAGVAPFLTVLAPISMARSISVLFTGYLQVIGKTRAFVVTEILLVVTMLGSMALLAPLGSTVAALGAGIAFCFDVCVLLWIIRPSGVRASLIADATMRPLLACGPMIAAVLSLRYALAPLALPAFARLGLEVAAGGLSYVGAAFLFAPAIARDFLELGLGTLRRRRNRKKTDDDSSRDSSPNSSRDSSPASAPASAAKPAADAADSADAANAAAVATTAVADAASPPASNAASKPAAEPSSKPADSVAVSITESAVERALDVAVEHTSEFASERGAVPPVAEVVDQVTAPVAALVVEPVAEREPESIMLPTTRSPSMHLLVAPVIAASEPSERELAEREPADREQAERERTERGASDSDRAPSERERPAPWAPGRPIRSHGPSRPMRTGGPGRLPGSLAARPPFRGRSS